MVRSSNVLIHKNIMYKSKNTNLNNNDTLDLKVWPANISPLELIPTYKPNDTNIPNSNNQNEILEDITPSYSSETTPSKKVEKIETWTNIDNDWGSMLNDQPAEQQMLINSCILNSYRYKNESSILSLDDTNIPQFYQEAVTYANRIKWLAAIQSELDSLQQYPVWDVIPRTEDIKTIPLKWIFVIKDDGTYKARLIIIGCKYPEKYSSDKIASPTPALSVIKMIFALSVNFGWHIEQ